MPRQDVMLDQAEHSKDGLTDIGALNNVEQQFAHADALDIDEVRLEKHFGRFEALTANFDHSAVGQLYNSRIEVSAVIA